jgi:hypothetical protein
MRSNKPTQQERRIEVAKKEVSTTSTSLTSTMKPGKAIDPKTAYKELAQIAGSREGSIALQKKRTGQTLTAGEARIVARHDALLAANAAQARAERPPLPGSYKSEKTYVSTRIQEIAKLPPFEQANAARGYRAELRRHPAFLDERHAEHKQILEEVHRTYGAEFYKDNTPVLPDENK